MNGKKRVLIVEDDTITAMMLQRSLNVMGYHVCDPVSTGLEAIRAAQEEKPDIIFMDVRIAGDINGVQAAEKIRETQDIPIAFMTGCFSDETEDLTRNIRPVGVITKPLEIGELRRLIDSVPKRVGS